MAAPKLLRVHPKRIAAVVHPETRMHVVPNVTESYREDDPLVQAHRWMFATEEEIAADQNAPAAESAPVERATRAPGERRNTRRTA